MNIVILFLIVAPGATPSPVNRQTAEDSYTEKRKQLSKYIEPLKKMIARIDKDESKPGIVNSHQ